MSRRLLTVCGSLQSRSANRAAIDVAHAYLRALPDVDIDDYAELALIPPLDAGLGDPGPVVDAWRNGIARADAVLIAAPEYAGALAGTIKNALDWIVGSGELYRKPVAVITAGTSGGSHARQMLIQTLTWQGAHVVAQLGIASPRTKSDAGGRFVDAATVAEIEQLTAVLVDAPTLAADDRLALAPTSAQGIRRKLRGWVGRARRLTRLVTCGDVGWASWLLRRVAGIWLANDVTVICPRVLAGSASVTGVSALSRVNGDGRARARTWRVHQSPLVNLVDMAYSS